MFRLFNHMQQQEKYRFFPLLLFFWCCAFILYFPAHHAGLVCDAIDWIKNYNVYGYHNLIHPPYDNTIRPVYHFCLITCWKLFGTNGYAWLMVTTGLHAYNVTIVFFVLRSLQQKLGFKNAQWSALLASFSFLISPLNTEPIVWYACIHYLITFACIFSIVWCIIHWQKFSLASLGIIISILYLIAILSLEVSYAAILLIAILFILFRNILFSNKQIFKIGLVTILPMLLLTLAFFVLTRLTYGKWIGHYGVNAVVNNTVWSITGKFFGHLLKDIFFFNHYGNRHTVNLYLQTQHTLSIVFFLIVGGCIYLLFFRNQYISPKWRFVLWLFLSLGAVYAPTCTLFFYDFMNIQTDRLEYFISPFIICLLIFGLYQISQPTLRNALLVVYLSIQLFVVKRNIAAWSSNRVLQESLINHANFPSGKRIFVLAAYTNFKGVYGFGVNQMVPQFESMYQVLTHGKNCGSEVHLIAYFNMNKMTDGVQVSVMNDSTLKVELNQWGSWFWEDMMHGLVSKKEKYYQIVKDEELNHYMLVTFTDKKPDDVYLYQVGNQWKYVKGF